MSAIFEGRTSESPYIQIIWRGRVEQDYAPVCPADANWNLLFTRYQGKVHVSAEGATTQFVPKTQSKGAEFLVIKFEHGVYMPYIPAETLVNDVTFLPNASSKNFWLHGASWQFPDYDNVETFVDWLVREEVLVSEPLVKAALENKEPDVSSRTIRRRFLHTTGLTPKAIQQINRAKQAASLIEQGVPILDAVYQLGYSDQPHLTRSLRRYYGQTPAEIARVSQANP